MNRFFASYWTIGAAVLGAASLHVWWFLRSAHQAEVLGGGGGTLTLLGVWFAARPYIRVGFAHFVEAGLPQDTAAEVVDDSYPEQFRQLQEAARPEVRRDVLAERVLALVMVVAGTILNSYAAPIARMFDLRGV